MRNWYGKEYFDNLKIQFEGEYINGKYGMEKNMIIMVMRSLK